MLKELVKYLHIFLLIVISLILKTDKYMHIIIIILKTTNLLLKTIN